MGEPGAAAGAGDDTIELGDEAVLTTDDTVQVTGGEVDREGSILAPDVITLEGAARRLGAVFGPLVDADYVPGKTLFCDALAAHFGVSILTAEELCDELERAGRIRFVRTEDGAGWHIHEAS